MKNYYAHITLRTILNCAIFIAAWPLFEIAWWRYALIVGSMNALRIFYGKEIHAS